MTVAIRRATPDDTDAIAGVMRAIWSEEAVSTETVRRAVAATNHATFIAVVPSGIGGFIDGFTTRSATGVLRWEIDLVAVLPALRGQHIGRNLIAACTDAGQQRGAALSRALIHVHNSASRRAFAQCGFHVTSETHMLAVAAGSAPTQDNQPPDFHVVPVETCRYRGIWLEQPLTAEGYRAARGVQLRDGCEVAGVVAPQHVAIGVGWVIIGRYDWWVR